MFKWANQGDMDRYERAVDSAIATCGGDLRGARSRRSSSPMNFWKRSWAVRASRRSRRKWQWCSGGTWR